MALIHNYPVHLTQQHRTEFKGREGCEELQEHCLLINCKSYQKLLYWPMIKREYIYQGPPFFGNMKDVREINLELDKKSRKRNTQIKTIIPLHIALRPIF